MDTQHGFTFYRLDEHDARRYITRDGFDAYSPKGTIAALDRFREQHVYLDRQRVKYSPRHPKLRPGGDNVSRFELEEELFGVRAMKHVYRIKRGIGVQGWVTVLNPVLPRGYPPQLVLTQLPDLTEPTFEAAYAAARGGSPEHAAFVKWRSEQRHVEPPPPGGGGTVPVGHGLREDDNSDGDIGSTTTNEARRRRA